MPFGMNAPKLWPAEPLNLIWMVSSGRPAAPHFFVTSLPVIVPTTRLTLRTGTSADTFSPRAIAGSHRPNNVVTSSDLSMP